jgi:hypothetical protein
MDGEEEASTTTAGGENGCVVATPVLRHPFIRPGIGIVRRRPCFDAMSASYLVEFELQPGESSVIAPYFIRRGVTHNPRDGNDFTRRLQPLLFLEEPNDRRRKESIPTWLIYILREFNSVFPLYSYRLFKSFTVGDMMSTLKKLSTSFAKV